VFIHPPKPVVEEFSLFSSSRFACGRSAKHQVLANRAPQCYDFISKSKHRNVEAANMRWLVSGSISSSKVENGSARLFDKAQSKVKLRVPEVRARGEDRMVFVIGKHQPYAFRD